LRQILFAASLNGAVPQAHVWDAIAREGITWYDPRDDFGTLKITFGSDNIASAFKLGAAVWLDGKRILDDQDVRDRSFSARVPTGKHLLEILPNTTEARGLPLTQERMRADIQIDYGKSASFRAVIHLTPQFPNSIVSVQSLRRVSAP
jgi:hypothetical protein